MIRLVIEKTINRGEREVVLTGASMLDNHKLPAEYTDEGPAIWMDGCSDMITIRSKDGKLRCLNANRGTIIATFSHEKFTEFCHFIRDCGQRLHEINKRLREENKNWKGVSVIEI